MEKVDEPKLREKTHPLAIQARHAFEKRRGPKLSLTFDEYYALFSTEDTFSTIGKIVSRAHNAESNVYRKYFQWMFPSCPTGRLRRTYFTQKKHLRLEESQSSDDLILRSVIDAAEREGLHTRQVLRSGETSCKTRVLFVNGHLCQIRRSTYTLIPNPLAKRFYTLVTLTPQEVKKYGFLVVYVEPKSITPFCFILPSALLIEAYGRQSRVKLILPINEGSGQQRKKPTIDFTHYRNAWHLLATPPKEHSPH